MRNEAVALDTIARRLPDLRSAPTNASSAVTGITHVSQRVEPGWMFACVRGSNADGHTFVDDAVRRGATAVLCDHTVTNEVDQLIVGDVRAALGPAAAAVYHDPSLELDVVGVTGTNGKTTTTWLLAAIMKAAGRPCGLLGTLSGAFTTPEAPDLQRELRAALERGEVAFAMEVSSHALLLGRVAGTRFAVSVFTNLTQDHLDLHGTIDAYFAAKATLFEAGRCMAAVVNRDDPFGQRLMADAKVPVFTFGADDAADLVLDARSARFTWRGQRVRLGFGGHFTVLNALAAATAASVQGIEPDAIAAGLSQAAPVPGRFEPVDAGQAFAVIVDYAHTPDGLANALDAARKVTERKLTVVFGCGGDRDRTKRPIMGRIAAERADLVVLTSDNPRSEVPAAIISDVLHGIPAANRHATVVEVDRRAAIALAFADAGPGDVVLVAGKGHEATQTIGTNVVAFDDRAVCRELLMAADS